MRLTLTTLLVKDYDEAIDFYVDRVGFALREDTDMGGDKRWVVVGPSGGGAGLLLAKAVSADQASAVGNQGGGRVMFFMETDDFAKEHARMTSAGVRFLEEPRHEPYGSVVVFEDLYGNRWDLIQRVSAG